MASDPSVEERVARLETVKATLKALLENFPIGWENDCETAFHDFRLRVVHLRREQAALDAVPEKELAWRFICRFSTSRPFLHDRCAEVLRILMLCPKWMEAFARDPECHVDDLPDDIAEDFARRQAEVTGEPVPPPRERKAAHAPARGEKAPPPGRAALPPEVIMPKMSGMAVVVQRCNKARVLLDERSATWGEIGHGLLVSISFSEGADLDRARAAARFLLSARLSVRPAAEPSRGNNNPFAAPGGGGYGGRGGAPAGPPAGTPESVTDICRAGIDQGILVMPQPSLVSQLDERGLDIISPKVGGESDGMLDLYKAFGGALQEAAAAAASGNGNGGARTAASTNPFAADAAAAAGDGRTRSPRIVVCPLGARHCLEMSSSDPYMRSFNF